jgi:hypothetical protein
MHAEAEIYAKSVHFRQLGVVFPLPRKGKWLIHNPVQRTIDNGFLALSKMKNAGGRHSPAACRRSAHRGYASGLMKSPVEVELAIMAENFGVFS